MLIRSYVLTICVVLSLCAPFGIAQSLRVTTLAGRTGITGSVDGPGGTALFDTPTAIATDKAGNIIVAMRNCLRKVTQDSQVSTLAGICDQPGYADGVPSVARFNSITAITVDASGAIFVCDYDNFVVRKLDQGVVSTIAGTPGQQATRGPFDPLRFIGPCAVAIDATGAVYVGDTAYPNWAGLWAGGSAVRRIEVDGTITTVAGGPLGHGDGPGAQAAFSGITGFVFDGSGTLFIADDMCVRTMTPDHSVRTLAGNWDMFGVGSVGTARFKNIVALAFDPAGALYVLDRQKNTIERLTADGSVATVVAGLTDRIGSADGTGPLARFCSPYGLAVSAAGAFYVGDTWNQTIRVGVVTTDGDTNGDGIVNAADVFYLINYLFAYGPQPIGSGDANHNQSVEAADIFYLINSIFANGPKS